MLAAPTHVNSGRMQAVFRDAVFLVTGIPIIDKAMQTAVLSSITDFALIRELVVGAFFFRLFAMVTFASIQVQ